MKKQMVCIILFMSAILYGMADEPTAGFPYLDIQRKTVALKRQRVEILQQMQQLHEIKQDLKNTVAQGMLTNEDIQDQLDNINEQIQIKNQEYQNITKKIEQVKSTLQGLE